MPVPCSVVNLGEPPFMVAEPVTSPTVGDDAEAGLTAQGADR